MKNETFKKIFITSLVIVNILNVLDIISTYLVGVEYEKTILMVLMISNLGFPFTVILKILSCIGLSFFLNYMFNRVTKIKVKGQFMTLVVMTITTINLVLYYIFVVTQNFIHYLFVWYVENDLMNRLFIKTGNYNRNLYISHVSLITERV